jgi:hypothetical protein
MLLFFAQSAFCHGKQPHLALHRDYISPTPRISLPPTSSFECHHNNPASIMFLITHAITPVSGNKANQVVDLTCEEPIGISDDEQGREAIDLTGTRIPASQR